MALSEAIIQEISRAAYAEVGRVLAETMLTTRRLTAEAREEAIGAVMVGAITAIARVAWTMRSEETIEELGEMVADIFEEALVECQAQEGAAT